MITNQLTKHTMNRGILLHFTVAQHTPGDPFLEIMQSGEEEEELFLQLLGTKVPRLADQRVLCGRKLGLRFDMSKETVAP